MLDRVVVPLQVLADLLPDSPLPLDRVELLQRVEMLLLTFEGLV
jgi:hypothetical protein